MAVNILTTEDLQKFKEELMMELKQQLQPLKLCCLQQALLILRKLK
jgi:hypothetical protein